MSEAKENISGDAKSVLKTMLAESNEMTVCCAAMVDKIKRANEQDMQGILTSENAQARTDLPWLILRMRLQIATLDKALDLVNAVIEARRVTIEVDRKFKAKNN